MSKVAAVSVAAALLLLIVCLWTIETKRKDYGPRALSRRLGYKIPPLLFDPLFTKMERIAGEKGFDEHNFRSKGFDEHNFRSNWRIGNELDGEEVDDYLSDGGRLNITARLIHLFPFLDKAPADGFVDFSELEAWIKRQANDRLNYRTQKELISHDKDSDGAISFREYLPHLSIIDLVRNGTEHGEAGWWKEQFKNADTDGNGILNFQEFRDFLHPEDSNNEEIRRWLLREKVKPIDYDHDEKLNVVEFKNGPYDMYKHFVKFETSRAEVPNSEEVFAKLDFNNDRLLSIEELKPVLQYLSPGELSYAKYYAGYLIHQADEDGDEKLTLDEMIRQEHIFYGTFYEDGIFEDDDELHEEL